jgi:hypothetical protein
VSAWLQGPDGVTGMGLRVNMALPTADRLADIADQFQEWEVEELEAAGRSATWPECPQHPKSHPLSPQVRDGAAVWSCPRNGHVEYPIGGMTPPGDAPRVRIARALPGSPSDRLPCAGRGWPRRGLAVCSRRG